MRAANYEIVKEDHENSILVIRDLGPWDVRPTVTNDVENVVRGLVRSGWLKPGYRLFYYDSEGALDEIVVKDGEFLRFVPGRIQS